MSAGTLRRAQLPQPQIDSSWRYISSGIDRVMNAPDTRELNGELYMNMYTAIHNFCVNPVMQPALSGSSGSVANSSELAPGGELYMRLGEYLDQHLSKLLSSTPPNGVELIGFYASMWTRYQASAKYLDHIFSYLNRHWVKQERDDAARHKSVCEVYTLCLLRWREVFYHRMAHPLIEAILALIKRDRDGENVNVEGIRRCTLSFHEIGIDAHLNKHPNLFFYTDEFETPFLKATRVYYETEAAKVLKEQGVVPYMRAVTSRLQQEQNRVRRYLLPCTEDRLFETLETTLIADHQAVLTAQFEDLVRTDSPDLRTLFILLRKVHDGLVPLCKKFADIVAVEGSKALDQLAASNSALNKPVDAKSYVDTVLEVYTKYLCLVASSCELSQDIRDALELGFARYVNSNAVAGTDQDCRTAELLARYIDSLLRRSPKALDEESFLGSLSGVVVVLKHTEDKDAFERSFTRLLSRRLVQQTSANADREAEVVADLQNLCGFEYTNKLLRMFQDVNTSTKLQTEFVEYENGGDQNQSQSQSQSNQEEGESKFQPLVLTEGFWPLPYRSAGDFKPPNEFGKTFDDFNEFYTKKHNGRRLKWLWNFAKGEMTFNFNEKSVTLLVSVYQMAILDAFNSADRVSVSELLELTHLPSELLEGSLALIVNAGVLLKEGDEYVFNNAFTSKKNRINLNLPLKETK